MRQPKVHTQLGRAAVQIFAANDCMNQAVIKHLILPLESPSRRARSAPLRRSLPTCTMSAASGSG